MNTHPSLRLIALLLPTLALAGCVHVNLPEHMVSDTVGVGKDLYTSIADKLRSDPQLGKAEQNGETFTLRQLGSQDTTVFELKRSCVNELVSQAKSRLVVQALDYKVISEAVDTRESSVVVKCQIAVKS